jgi:hypothetical protein
MTHRSAQTVHILWGSHAVSQYKARRVDNSVRLAHAAYDFLTEEEIRAFLLGINEACKPDEWIRVTSLDYIKLLGQPLRIQLLDAAISGDAQDLAKVLRTGVNPNSVDENDLSSLHHCAVKGFYDSARLLLQSSADANLRAARSKNISAIHITSAIPSVGHLKILEMFIKEGFNIDITDANGDRPLHYACRVKNIRGIEMLLRGGAIPTYANDLKETPIDIALEDEELTRVFEDNIQGKIELTTLAKNNKRRAQPQPKPRTGNK